MADVLSLKDGSVETLFEPKDFQYLVEKYMGYDAETYFRTFEASLESNARCFNDLLESIKEAVNLLDEKRLNKTQMGKLLSKMGKQINNQI